jgi:integrase
MTITKARDTANRLLDGWEYRDEDPRLARNSKSISKLTLRDDIEAYIANRMTIWKKSNKKKASDKIRWATNRHCGALLNKLTHKITAGDIVTVLREAKQRQYSRRRKATRQTDTVYYLKRLLTAIFRLAMNGEHKERFALTAKNPVDEASIQVPLPKKAHIPYSALPVDANNQHIGIADHYAQIVLWPTLRKKMRGGVGQWRGERAVSPNALRLFLLTCCPRSHEVRQARWGHFYLDGPNPEWVIDGEVMKMQKKRENDLRRIPLSYIAVAFLRSIKPVNAKPNDLVFSYDGENELHEHTMLAHSQRIQQRLGQEKTTLHGLRGTMLSFAAEYHPDLAIAAQIALDHEPFQSVSDTYMRTTLPMQRLLLAELWGEFLESKLPEDMRTPRPEAVEKRRQMYATPPSYWPDLQRVIAARQGDSPAAR